MTYRELLEAAAKAAGLEIEYWAQADYPVVRDGASTVGWDPLNFDSDALQLAVRLKMCIEPWGSGAAAVVSVANRARVVEPHYGDDPGRATRRAIVRAAAAIGENESCRISTADDGARDLLARCLSAADEIEKLRDALTVVRELPDFDDGGPLAEMIDQVLAGKDSPLLAMVARFSQMVKRSA